MTESIELKPGDIVKIKVGDKTLTLEPIPLGRMKELMKFVFAGMDKMSKMDGNSAFQQIPQIMEEYLPNIVPLIFSKKKHPFINQEWVEENITYIHMKEIFEKGIVINGMKDFLSQMGKPVQQAPQVASHRAADVLEPIQPPQMPPVTS